MRGLLLRLSAIDADAEAAVRIIAYFDALAVGGASPAAVVRSAAALAECPAGYRATDGAGLCARPDGTPVPVTAARPESGGVELDGGGRVWLERPGGPGPFDELVLERFALCAALLAHEPRIDPAPVELLISGHEPVEARVRAARLLGLDPGHEVRVAAAESWPSHRRAAVIGDVTAVVLRRGEAVSGVRAGVGDPVPVVEAHRSWTQAQLALRYADGTTVVEHASLGPLTLLADVPRERLLAEPDVVGLAGLPAGDVAALTAFCRTGSLRQAATELHLHHSSVANRLTRVEQALGWRLDGPDGRFRARVALLALKLSR